MEWHRLRDSSMRAHNPVSLLFSAPSSVSFPQLRVSGAVQSHDARTWVFFFFSSSILWQCSLSVAEGRRAVNMSIRRDCTIINLILDSLERYI